MIEKMKRNVWTIDIVNISHATFVWKHYMIKSFELCGNCFVPRALQNTLLTLSGATYRLAETGAVTCFRSPPEPIIVSARGPR